MKGRDDASGDDGAETNEKLENAEGSSSTGVSGTSEADELVEAPQDMLGVDVGVVGVVGEAGWSASVLGAVEGVEKEKSFWRLSVEKHLREY